MFKKASVVQQQRKLSGADTKKLKRAVRDKFPLVSDEEINLLLPPKVDMHMAKMSNRSIVYTPEGGPPMLFDIDGRGDVCPTVYALWKVASFLPSFTLKGGEVSRYVLGGADLMFPGINVPPGGLPSFKAGELWSIKVPQNDAPIAVGSTLLSSDDAAKAGLRGKALKVLHYYSDTLWESAENKYVPNAGFLEGVVVEDSNYQSPTEEGAGPSSSSNADMAEGGSNESAVSNKNDGRSADNGRETEEGIACGDSADVGGRQRTVVDSDLVGVGLEAADGGEGGQLASRVADLTLGEEPEDRGEGDLGAGAGAGAGQGLGSGALSAEDMDDLLDSCLLQALHTMVKDKDLPLASSTLWSQYILPCRPPGSSVDIKKSTHKKLSKWLQAKASAGLIAAKEDKHRKEMILLSVNRRHPDYAAFVPRQRQVAAPEEPGAAGPSGATQAGPSSSDGAASVEVVEVWRCAPAVTKIFEAVGADPAGFLMAQEASAVAFAYVAQEGLDKRGDPATVVLDPMLCDALFKGAVKKGSAYPTEIAKRDLGPAFLHRMQAHHQVSRGGQSVVRKGALREVQILTERRSGNKKVTRLTGMESFLVDADALAAELQKRFACSTAVGEVPGKKNEKEVLVQGGVLEDLARYLVQHYGIPKKHIEVLDKTRK